MDKTQSTSARIEDLLQEHYQAPEPDPAFLSRTRTDLLSATTELTSTQPRLSGRWTIRSWRYALAGALLLILGAVLIIGPGQVWAQLESWIAYLPGFGKVELSGTRVLEEPVSYSEDGITFTVEEFVASPKETFISILISGFPESIVQDLESEELDISRFSDPIKVYWADADGGESKLFFLSMSTGTDFRPCPTEYCRYMQLEGIKMKAVGGAIPLEITQVQVDWFPYGILPEASPTDTWTLTIPLGPISDEYAQDFIQPGYSPQSAEDFQHGVKISVEDVFSDSSGTVIDVFIVPPEPASVSFFGFPEVFLSADTGYQSGITNFSTDMDMMGAPLYKVTPEVPRATTIAVWPARWQFAPLGDQSSRMTLEIGSIYLSYDTHETQYMFEVEIGPDPEVGTSFPLDISFDVESFPLHIYQARIVMAPEVIDGLVKDVKAIEFLAETSLTTDGKRLKMISFCPYDQKIVAMETIGGSYSCRSDVFPLEPDIIQDGKVRVSIDDVEIEQFGPWIISWDVP